jgi:hypothetical protein
MKNVPILCAVLGLACALPSARADEEPGPSTEISLTNQLQAWVDDTTRAASYLDLCDLQVSRGPWLIGGRFEFDEETRLDPQRVTGVTRRFAEYRDEHVTLRGGTFYATLGRGLLLRAEEDAAVRLDRDIDGVYHAARWRALDGQVLIGRPRNDRTYQRDDLLAGAELGVQAGPALHLGAGYLRRDASTPAGGGTVAGPAGLGRPGEELAGGSARWQRGALEFYGEGARRFVWGRYDPVLGWTGVSTPDGHAGYGSLTVSVPGYSLLLEGKDYLRFDAPYSTLPPANTAGQPVNNGLDERGAGAILTASPHAALTLDAAASHARARNGAGRRSSAEAHARRDWWGRGSIQPGFEWVDEAALPFEGYDLREWSGPTLNASYYLDAVRSLSLHAKAFDRTDEPSGYPRIRYTEVTADLGVLVGEGRAITFSLTRTSQPLPKYENQDVWGSVELDWIFSASHELKLKAGRERGGIVCSGGVCHYEPPFAGVRFEFISRW